MTEIPNASIIPNNQTNVKPDYEQVKQTLGIFHPNSVFEIRILGNIRYTGFFSSPDLAVAGLKEFVETIGLASTTGIYFTLNPVDTAKLDGKYKNTIALAAKGEATADINIVKRNWLLLDIDPIREATVSSTNTEKEAAFRKATFVKMGLEGAGWGSAILGDSGNGYHLLYAINLPNEDDELVEKVLKALADRFSIFEPKVKIDISVHNPARINKLYGTYACKGKNTPETPHRLSALLEIPKDMKPVSVEALSSVIPTTVNTPPPPQPYTGQPSTQTLEEWATQYKVRLDLAGNSTAERKAYYVICAFNPEHGKGTDTQVYEWLLGEDKGKRGFQCKHDSCQGKTWKDYRAKVEDNYAETIRKKKVSQAEQPKQTDNKDIPKGTPSGIGATGSPQQEPEIEEPTVELMDEFLKRVYPPTQYLFDGLGVKGGLILLASLPKAGKSTFLRFLIKQLLHGGELLGCDAQLEDPIITLLDYETAPDGALQQFIRRLLPPNGSFGNRFERIRLPWTLGDNPVERMEALLFKNPNRNRPVPNVIIIDTAGKFYPKIEDPNNYAEVGRFLSALKNLCNKYGCSIIVAHHNKKSNDPLTVPKTIDEAMDRIHGSVNYRSSPDCNIVMFKDPKDNTNVVFFGEQRTSDNSSFTINTKYDKKTQAYAVEQVEELTFKEKEVWRILFKAYEPLTVGAITALLPEGQGKADKPLASLCEKQMVASGEYTSPKSHYKGIYYCIERYLDKLENPSITREEFATAKYKRTGNIEDSPSVSMASLDLDNPNPTVSKVSVEQKVPTGTGGSATNTPVMGQEGVGTTNTKDTATEVAATCERHPGTTDAERIEALKAKWGDTSPEAKKRWAEEFRK